MSFFYSSILCVYELRTDLDELLSCYKDFNSSVWVSGINLTQPFSIKDLSKANQTEITLFKGLTGQ